MNTSFESQCLAADIHEAERKCLISYYYLIMQQSNHDESIEWNRKDVDNEIVKL